MGNCEWFAFKVKTGKESNVKDFIEKKKGDFGIVNEISDVFIPIKEKVDIVNGKKKIIQKNEYPGYIFINADIDDQKVIDLLRITPDLFGKKYNNSKLGILSSPLSQSDIDKLFGKVNICETQTVGDFSVGDVVRIINGPFANFDGKVFSINEKNQSITVNVSIFSRDTKIEVLFSDVEKLLKV